MKWKDMLKLPVLGGLLCTARVLPRKGIPILTYHSIDTTGGPTSISPEIFDRQMAFLQGAGFRSISLSESGEIKQLPDEPVVVLTFDDGYENHFDKVFPILQKYKLTATIFLITEFINKFNDWEQSPGIPRLRHLNSEQIMHMSGYGIEFGSHTCTHPDLTALPAERAREEIYGSRRFLENLLGKAIKSFCYPFGALNETVKSLVKDAGFACACTSRFGMGRPDRDLLSLSRLGMNRLSVQDPFLAELYLRNCLQGSAPLYFEIRDLLYPASVRKQSA
jgi:peptidoglycan/xylan/chitin deacetylase (PgdA/CDA1 family)